MPVPVQSQKYENHLNFILQVFSQIPLGYLNTSLDGANVWALIAAAVQVPGDRKPSENL